MKVMKVLGISGSPRKGNTELLVREALKAAEKAGAITQLVLLKNLEIKHCDGCLRCDEDGTCRTNDEMQELYKRMETADAIIIGSPTYYENVPGLLKDFIDRSNPFYTNKKLKGKLGGIIVVGEETTGGAVRAIKSLFSEIVIKVVGVVEAIAGDAGEVAKDKTAMSEAAGLGKGIVEMLK